jgi:hypothetical protein
VRVRRSVGRKGVLALCINFNYEVQLVASGSREGGEREVELK